jgi:hypothetical protein
MKSTVEFFSIRTAPPYPSETQCIKTTLKMIPEELEMLRHATDPPPSIWKPFPSNVTVPGLFKRRVDVRKMLLCTSI